MHISSWGVNHFRRTHPWVPAWWSAVLPGMGHIYLGMYLKGFVLMSLEIILNSYGKLNMAIIYTFTLQFDKVHEIANLNWLLIYAAVFVFSIYDAYRVGIEINKHSLLESKQSIRELKSAMINSVDLNYLDKRNPWVAVVWSAAFIGLGHLYCHRLITGFGLILWNLAIVYFTHLPYLLVYTFTGHFDLIPGIVDYQWLLFYPSIYLFSIYDAYASVVSSNSMFEEEQMYYLLGKYGNKPIEL